MEFCIVDIVKDGCFNVPLNFALYERTNLPTTFVNGSGFFSCYRKVSGLI